MSVLHGCEARGRRGRLPAVLGGLVLLLAAGCGSGGGSGPSGAFSIRARSSTPADQATGVPVQPAEVRIQFSDALDPATVDTSTVQLEDLTAGGAVLPGTVRYEAATREIVWELAQSGRNPLLPGQVAFEYSHRYRLVVSGVHSAATSAISAAASVSFETEPAQLAIVRSDPAPGTSTALVEPAMFYLPGNRSLEAIVTVELSHDVDPVAVTDTALVRLEDLTGGLAATLQNAELNYDPATRTLGWRMTAPQGAGLANTVFPNEPVLRFDTEYRLVIDRSVPMVVTGASFVSANDVVLTFRTARFAGAPSAPAAGTLSAEVLINEVYANVDATGALGTASDANKDGHWDEAFDEFVEIVNLTDSYLDLTAHEITDVSGSGNEQRFLAFPGTAGVPELSALLPPHAAIVYFGGKAGTPDLRAIGAGRSKLLFGNRTQGALNNSGDVVRLYGPARTPLLSVLDFKTGGVTPPLDESMNRDPDADPSATAPDAWAPHSSVSPTQAVQSAGTRPDGTPYR